MPQLYTVGRTGRAQVLGRPGDFFARQGSPCSLTTPTAASGASLLPAARIPAPLNQSVGGGWSTNGPSLGGAVGTLELQLRVRQRPRVAGERAGVRLVADEFVWQALAIAPATEEVATLQRSPKRGHELNGSPVEASGAARGERARTRSDPAGVHLLPAQRAGSADVGEEAQGLAEQAG